MWDVLTTGNDFACIIVFFSTTVRITVFDRTPVAHNLILPSVCARRAYPWRFLGRVGRTPYRSHSLGDGSEHRRRQGLKTICIAPTRTSVYLELYFYSPHDMCFVWSVFYDLSLCLLVYHNHPCCTHLLREPYMILNLIEYSMCFTYIFWAI